MKNFIYICQGVLTLFGLMIIGLFVTNLAGLIPVNGFAHQWLIFSGQNILAFIVPAILVWKFQFKVSPLKAMEAENLPEWIMIIVMLLIYFASMPALNQVVYWNQEMHLPDSLRGFEDWCRKMEELAENQTKGLLNTTALFPTVMNILVIGVLTGIGEEFFFRGGLQRILNCCGIDHHVAIWTAALIFSALHFQFFGFIPRVLLGAMFGYLYWWTGNIWVNSAAHALNNSLVIVSNWLINIGYLSEEFDMLGVSNNGFPSAAVISICVVALIIYIIHRKGMLRGHSDSIEALISNSKISNSKANGTESY